MKKTILAFLVMALTAMAVQAQSLSENAYYLKSVQLETAARTAFEEGDYDLAVELAAEAQENARLSDEYVAMMISMRAATKAIASAQVRYDWATSLKAELRYAADYTGASTELAAAKAAFEAEAYDEAIVHAYAVEAYLVNVNPEEALPAYFLVRSLAVETDCLWRIAALPYIYNDPFQWPVLYRANKKLLPDPNNPHLILPDTVLSIPPLKGELREGTWTEGYKYPVFKH
ncbi:MAG: hypothetical protein A2Y38_20880 [Spirochaetes bacterium GWB1_59_5]|nr:MAG: hypothetical protein A2Y38_20880 [Spirochaetes bacterium GWB1_59_5]